MKKFFAPVTICILFMNASLGQSHTLYAHVESGKIYLQHSVVPKENWYSVGRIYNLSPRDIAPFNGLTLENPLAIGQELKIPLSPTNFSQDGKKDADETFVPVYHNVKGNEQLANISATYNGVSVENLEHWNRIKKAGISPGMRLIVGYLKVKSSLSYLANEGVRNSDVVVVSKENKSSTNDIDKKPLPQAPPVSDKQPEPKTVKPQEPTSPPTTDNKPLFVSNNSNAHANGGYFANEFNDNNNKISGIAGTFKSSSGWNDGKYYVLINNVQVGTIIKVIAPATQKSVYAKVLGQLPDMKESEGLTIRISNAAASELGEGEGKFNVMVRY